MSRNQPGSGLSSKNNGGRTLPHNQKKDARSALTRALMSSVPHYGGGSVAVGNGCAIQFEAFALEPRIVFDGAVGETAVDAAGLVAEGAEAAPVGEDDSGKQLVEALMVPMASPAGAREFVFVDGAVDGHEAFVEAAGADVQMIVLDRDRDGVEQIAGVLATHRNVDAVHIGSHGRSGTLDLGSAKLTEASMAGIHADDLQVIRQAMSENADLFIYGCSFGANARGASAVEALAAATGADVAASNDLTGAKALGGDWDLETRQGAF